MPRLFSNNYLVLSIKKHYLFIVLLHDFFIILHQQIRQDLL